MRSSPIFEPVLALLLWTFVMWVWLYATRLPAMFKLGIVYDKTKPNEALLGQMPPTVRWKADNYNNLMEQPPMFYAVALILAFIGMDTGLNLWLAWTYVAIRVVHSLWQALFNVVEVRFGLFALGSVVLFVLTVRAAWAVFAF
jgi:hypothetical protein